MRARALIPAELLIIMGIFALLLFDSIFRTSFFVDSVCRYFFFSLQFFHFPRRSSIAFVSKALERISRIVWMHWNGIEEEKKQQKNVRKIPFQIQKHWRYFSLWYFAFNELHKEFSSTKYLVVVVN